MITDLILWLLTGALIVGLGAWLAIDAGSRWHQTARPRHEHEWERIGVHEWGYLVERCQTCPRERIVDLDGQEVYL